ncbi:MAG: hemerythrin domain-containing protein [Acidobacteriaceae bacterium]|nr:hemerythrin domain-containing protein [Acidobacteriaceae bacterium]
MFGFALEQRSIRKTADECLTCLRHPYGVNKSRTYLLLGLGTAAGALLGRLLPVVFANASGVAQGLAGLDPFAQLIQQHRTLLSVLDKMEHLTAPDWAKRRLLFLALKRTIGKHALAEENVVYPLLKTQAERHESTQKLYREHASMKIHIFELEVAIRSTDEWRDAVRALRSEIEPHAREEEQTEFPACGSCWTKKGPLN